MATIEVDGYEGEMFPEDAEPEAYHYGYTSGWLEAEGYYQSEIEDLRQENADLRYRLRGLVGA